MSDSLTLAPTVSRSLATREVYEQEPPSVFSDILPVHLPSGIHKLPVQLRIHSPTPWQDIDDEPMVVQPSRRTYKDQKVQSDFYYWNLFHGPERLNGMRENHTIVWIEVSPISSWWIHSVFDKRWEPPYGHDPFSVTIIEERFWISTIDGSPTYGHVATGTSRRRLLWGDFTEEQVEQLARVRDRKRAKRPKREILPRNRAFRIEELSGNVQIDLRPVEYTGKRSWREDICLPHAFISKGYSDTSPLSLGGLKWAWTEPVRTQDMELKSRRTRFTEKY